MTMKDIRELETKRIHEQLRSARDKVRELRFGLINREVKHVREVRQLKRDIARLLTVLKERLSIDKTKAPDHKA